MTKTLEKKSFFTESEKALIDPKKVPNHIALIPDGNRRWAKEHAKESIEGHRYGADMLLDIVKAAKELGVKVLTVYSFSTENWKRPLHEINFLMHIFESYLAAYRKELIDNNIRFNTIGFIEKLPQSLISIIEKTKTETSHCTEFDFILALNYGGRNELFRAIQKMLLDCEKGLISSKSLSEEMVSLYLDTPNWPDPDFIIRTSGERRLSNFLLWQSSYAELYIDDVMWPQFTPQRLLQALLSYQDRDRRRGGGIVK